MKMLNKMNQRVGLEQHHRKPKADLNAGSPCTVMEDKEQKKVHFSHEDESIFNTMKHALTPALSRITNSSYKVPEERASQCVAPPSTISRPNYEGLQILLIFFFVFISTLDILKRVTIVIHQHIQRCEQRLAKATPETFNAGLFHVKQMEKFSEELFTTPQYVYHFVRAPISRMGFLYGIRKLSSQYSTPTLQEVHTFLSDLFVKAQLSAECSIGKKIRNCCMMHYPVISVPNLRGKINGDRKCTAGGYYLEALPTMWSIVGLQSMAGFGILEQ